MARTDFQKTQAGHVLLLSCIRVSKQPFELQSCSAILELSNVIFEARIIRKTDEVIWSIYFI